MKLKKVAVIDQMKLGYRELFNSISWGYLEDFYRNAILKRFK